MRALEDFFELGRRLGLRILHPFWDLDLFEFLCRVPPKLLHKGDRSKALVRSMLEKRFPSLGLGNQRKIDTDALSAHFMKEQGPYFWGKLEGVCKLADLGLVNPKLLKNEVNLRISKSEEEDVVWFWTLLNLEGWLKARN